MFTIYNTDNCETGSEAGSGNSTLKSCNSPQLDLVGNQLISSFESVCVPAPQYQALPQLPFDAVTYRSVLSSFSDSLDNN